MVVSLSHDLVGGITDRRGCLRIESDVNGRGDCHRSESGQTARTLSNRECAIARKIWRTDRTNGTETKDFVRRSAAWTNTPRRRWSLSRRTPNISMLLVFLTDPLGSPQRGKTRWSIDWSDSILQRRAGETTKKIQSYHGRGNRLFHVPGRNNDLSYFSMEYIAFWKELTRWLMLTTATIKEISQIFRLLDALQLTYDIAVNKSDLVPFWGLKQLKQKIDREIQQAKLTCVKKVLAQNVPSLFERFQVIWTDDKSLPRSRIWCSF